METVDVWADSSFNCPKCDDVCTYEDKEFEDKEEIECTECETKFIVRNI